MECPRCPGGAPGQCESLQTCKDTCAAGTQSCQGDVVIKCLDHDGDGCVSPQRGDNCADNGKICEQEAPGRVTCATPAPMGAVVLNEVFYDPMGSDRDSNTGVSPTFVELSGPPGMPIGGWELRFTRGVNGDEYNRAALPADAKLDGQGLAVITMTETDAFLTLMRILNRRSVHDILTPVGSTDGVINGSASVTLHDAQGAQVDGLGWGDFRACMTSPPVVCLPGRPDLGVEPRSTGRCPASLALLDLESSRLRSLGPGCHTGPSRASSVFHGEGAAAEDVVEGHLLGRAPGAADTDDHAADFYLASPTPAARNAPAP